MSSRYWIVMCLLLLFSNLTLAQDNDVSPYETALERITEAQAAEATRLNLSNLGLSELPPEIGQVTSLEQIDLSRNRLSELPSEFGELTNLRSLELQNNEFETFPEIVLELRNLQALFLGDNDLDDIPREISRLSNLQQLHLQNMGYIWLPLELGSMENLTRLELNETDPHGIPQPVVNRGGLGVLDYLKAEWQKEETRTSLITLAKCGVPLLLLVLLVGLYIRRYRLEEAKEQNAQTQ